VDRCREVETESEGAPRLTTNSIKIDEIGGVGIHVTFDHQPEEPTSWDTPGCPEAVYAYDVTYEAESPGLEEHAAWLNSMPEWMRFWMYWKSQEMTPDEISEIVLGKIQEQREIDKEAKAAAKEDDQKKREGRL